jgi:crotonobetainyl-CoA:carnitine CoA-transferase CaiB-like acyl-CoA transferase
MAAPFCSMNLPDMGADVIKIEPPGEGEQTRRLGPAQRNGHSATFMAGDLQPLNLRLIYCERGRRHRALCGARGL